MTEGRSRQRRASIISPKDRDVKPYFAIFCRLQQWRRQNPRRDGVGVGRDDVVGDLLAGGDEGQRQAVLGLQGQQATEAGMVGGFVQLR